MSTELAPGLQEASMAVVLVEEHRLPTMTTLALEAGSTPGEPLDVFPEEFPEDSPQDTQVKTISDPSPPTSPSPSVVYTHTTEDVKTKLEPMNDSRASWSSTSSSDPVCRICHDTEDERGKTKLISPCGCSGSAQFTHKKCLQKWTRVKGATTCEICNQGYKPKYIRFKQKLLTRQVMCMGSAASLPLLVVIIVGFFLLGEQLSLGKYDEDGNTSTTDLEDDGVSNTSKLMVSICMIATATFGIFLLCCFSIWAAKVQPQQLEVVADSGPFGLRERDVESGRGQRNNLRNQRVPAPLYFF